MSTLDDFDLSPGSYAWPVPAASLREVRQTVMADRDGKGRPHYGVDLKAPPGTPILASTAGRVLRIVDGRTSTDEHQFRAGLWVDIVGISGLVFRYLHLTTSILTVSQFVKQRAIVGFLGSKPDHLHFEIRRHDVINGKYGEAIDPLKLLPRRSV